MYICSNSLFQRVSGLVVATVLALRFGRRVLQTILEVRKQQEWANLTSYWLIVQNIYQWPLRSDPLGSLFHSVQLSRAELAVRLNNVLLFR